MKTKLLSFLCIFFSLAFFSCKDDKVEIEKPFSPDVEVGSPDYCYVNRLISDCQAIHYLWNEEINTRLNIYSYDDPFEYFGRMKYKDDKWSTLTDDIKGLSNSFAGVETNYGYSLQFWRFDEYRKDIFAIVEFVYEGSPAEQAGLERGDIIFRMDGKDITTANYTDLYYSSSITISLGEYAPEEYVINPIGKDISLTAVTMYQNPVLETRIIEKGSHIIGYLHYTDYTLKSHKQLQEVIAEFKTAGVTELVLDLRYNPGGYSVTSQYLCSMLVPSSFVNSKSIYLTEKWNQMYMDYYASIKKDTNTYFTYAYSYTDDGKVVNDVIQHNLELKDIYILTSRNTASASEATIIGLSPYVNVTLIGEKTSGKYCGGILVSADDMYEEYPAEAAFLENWGLYTMVYRFDNADPHTIFDGGLSPDIELEEDLLENRAPLGDEKEALLATAIAKITGQPLPAAAPRSSSSLYNKIPAVSHRVQQAVGGMVETGRSLPGDYK